MIIGRMLKSLINKSLELTVSTVLNLAQICDIRLCINFLTMVVKEKFSPLYLLDCMG